MTLPNKHQLQIEALRNRALIHTLFSTAMRNAEAAHLTRAQCANGGRNEVTLTHTKGSKTRIVWLDAKAQQAIRAYCIARDDRQPSLFISHRRGKGESLSGNSINRIVSRYAYLAGCHSDTTPHHIRHWVATDWLNHGMPITSVQQLLGHASIETTRRVYAHTLVNTLRDHYFTYVRQSQNQTKQQ